MTTFTCPCCNSTIQAPPDVTALGSLATGVKGAVLRQLIASYPRGVTMYDLISEVYDGASEPDNAYHVVAIATSDLRYLLKPYGWTIPSIRGGGHDRGSYKLQPLADA